MNNFTILPAIDLKDGKCVRLRQGKADDVKVYSGDPVEMALHWQELGAQYLHLVDLDGAFDGKPVHRDLIGRIVAALDIPAEVGGGLRTDEDIRRYIDLGMDRVIIGTRALAQPEELKALAAEHGGRLAVGIDAVNGMVQIKGWTETTSTDAFALAKQMEDLGIGTVIYTDTSRDGMLAGVNTDAMRQMCDAVTCRVIASGGVSTAEDVLALKALNCANLAGVIIGKALYEERFTLPEVL